MRTRTTNGRLPMAVLTAVALTTAACGGEPADDLPPAASPPPAEATAAGTPGLDLSPTEQEAVDEARAQFDRFMNAYIDVSTADLPTAETAEDVFAKVDEHIGGGDLSDELRGEVVGRWAADTVIDGTIEWTFLKVEDINLEREVDGTSSPQVGLSYCVDATGSVPVDASTGETAGEPGARGLWTVALIWSDDWFGQGLEGWRLRSRDEAGSC